VLHQEPPNTPGPATYVQNRCAFRNSLEHYPAFASRRVVEGVARMSHGLPCHVPARPAHVSRN
jgi:hypothetical protein